jgi:hypothetical protein
VCSHSSLQGCHNQGVVQLKLTILCIYNTCNKRCDHQYIDQSGVAQAVPGDSDIGMLPLVIVGFLHRAP